LLQAAVDAPAETTPTPIPPPARAAVAATAARRVLDTLNKSNSSKLMGKSPGNLTLGNRQNT
jgi:hypothetical protein